MSLEQLGLIKTKAPGTTVPDNSFNPMPIRGAGTFRR